MLRETRHPSKTVLVLLICFLTAVSSVPSLAQAFAIVTPERSDRAAILAASLSTALASQVPVRDLSLSDSAFRAIPAEDPYNLTVETARNIGSSIGCRFFVILKTGLQRRSSSARPEYYEAFAVYYLVSSLSGGLTNWSIVKFEEDTPELAEERLKNSVGTKAVELAALAGAAETQESASRDPVEMIEASEADAETRPPLPFKRIKPGYTQLAGYYNIAATVDFEVEVSAEGKIIRTTVVRWAGYGLEESVEKAIREMQWRPADRKGKTLPMRVLLRYNFRDLENEQN